MKYDPDTAAEIRGIVIVARQQLDNARHALDASDEALSWLSEQLRAASVDPKPTTAWADNPQAAEIDQVIRAAETLLRTESTCLRNVWLSWQFKMGSKTHDRAWSAVCNAAKDARRSDEFQKARNAACAAGGTPAQDAAVALVVRDLIDESTDWNRRAYDYLTHSWAAVIGPAHPDDVQVDR